MPTPDDYDDNPGRAVTHALVAMVAVAVLVGAAVGIALMAAAKIGGLSDDAGAAVDPDADSPASLYMPSYQPTKDAGSGWNLPRPVASPSALPSSGGSSSSESPDPDGISLEVSPQQVAAGERINFNGTYPEGDGATLQVQRQDGSTWTDFPVTASVSGGSFGTWILTSRTGATKFRMYDASADLESNVVTVQIG